MELFRYYSKGGQLCIVHTFHHDDRFDKEWSLRINQDPYDYYRREQDAKSAGTRLKKKLIENGVIIKENTWICHYTDGKGNEHQKHFNNMEDGLEFTRLLDKRIENGTCIGYIFSL